MNKPTWAKDDPATQTRKKPKKTAFNRCPNRSVELPRHEQGGAAVRCFADLGPDHIRFLAEHQRAQDRGQGSPPSNYVRWLWGFDLTAAEAAAVDEMCGRV